MHVCMRVSMYVCMHVWMYVARIRDARRGVGGACAATVGAIVQP